jgi:hypothetical protein
MTAHAPDRHNGRMRLCLAFAALAASLPLLACNDPPAQDPAALEGSALAVGESGRVGDLEVVLESYRLEEVDSGDARTEQRLLVATLLLTNTGDDGYSLSAPALILAYDAGGKAYAVEEESERDAALRLTLPPGGQMRGEARFTVPREGAPYSVEVQQPVGPERAVWRLGTETDAAATGTSSPVREPPGALAAGSTAAVGDAFVTVEGYRIDRESRLVEARGKVLLLVKMAVENTGDNDYAFSLPVQVRLQDAAGFVRAQPVFAGPEETLPSLIRPGETARGEIPFEIPADLEPPFYVTFTQAFGDVVEVWVLR